MLLRLSLVASLVACAAALHEHGATPLREGDGCVAPGTCVAPAGAKYSRVIVGPKPGQQWNENGGFCGAWSVQQCALAHGAWISQDLVRKANAGSPPPHTMHGDADEGYEVMPSNVAFTARALKLAYDEWDYTSPTPQAPAYKRWLKRQLARGAPVAWFPLCKGDGHECYAGSCPNGGACDHVEPVFGLYSNRSLDELEAYDDDVIVHASDQDFLPYYRAMRTLEDTVAMDGNCAAAQAGFGKNEMYPCIDADVTYGLAVTGLAVDDGAGELARVALEIDAAEEPDVREGEKPLALRGTLTVTGLTPGAEYALYRYNGTAALPAAAPFDLGAEVATRFTPTLATWRYVDPEPLMSNTAVYYLAVAL